MNEKMFWSLIDRIDRAAMDAGDGQKAVAPLRVALGELPVRDIEAWEEMLAQKLYLIDGEVFAHHAGESGQSGDCFLYARCHAVARGQASFDSLLANPALMPARLGQELEGLLYVSSEAWAAKTGGDAEEWDFDATLSYETGSNAGAWPSRPVSQQSDPFDLRLDRAVTRAGHAFRKKEYDTVVKVLERHETLLSKKQAKMLRESRTALLAA